MWAAYHKETEGHDVVENADGFIRFSFLPPLCLIHDLYVRPEKRRERAAWKLADEVSVIAKKNRATHLWSKVWTGSLTAHAALKSNLAYGFKVQDAKDGYIIMMKELQD